MEDFKKLNFTVTRNDLLYDYASNFEEVFKFAPYKDNPLLHEPGVRLQENLGYDFASECSPVLKITPPDIKMFEELGVSPDELQVIVTIEDIALGIRKNIYQFDMSDITKPLIRHIELTDISDLAFYRGFIVKCYVTRQSNLKKGQEIIWNKSQTFFETEFVIKASEEAALFEITWVDFNDNDNSNDVLIFVEWDSYNVSQDIDIDCFKVKANTSLKTQFKRLENNKAFGNFCIRLIAEKVLTELLFVCLQQADLNSEPLEDSLHDKFQNLLNENGIDFKEVAIDFQSTIKSDNMGAKSDMSKLIQNNLEIGTVLEKIKFGGYR